MDVLSIGSEVKIGGELNGIIGKILQISFDGHNVSYKVAWWSGRDRKFEWLDSNEIIKHISGNKTSIGFK